MSIRELILAFPIVLLIHNLEEVLTVRRFFARYGPGLPRLSWLKVRTEVTTLEFAVATTLVQVVATVAAWLAARSPGPGHAADRFAAIVSLMFLNVFTHLGQTLVLRTPTPGVVSAVALVLPYSTYCLARLRRAGLVDAGRLKRAAIAGAVMGMPVALGAHALGRLVVGLTRKSSRGAILID